MRYRLFLVPVLLPLLVVIVAAGVETDPAPAGLRPVSADRVEATFQGLTLEDKVGQVLMSYPPLDKQGPVGWGGAGRQPPERRGQGP